MLGAWPILASSAHLVIDRVGRSLPLEQRRPYYSARYDEMIVKRESERVSQIGKTAGITVRVHILHQGPH